MERGKNLNLFSLYLAFKLALYIANSVYITKQNYLMMARHIVI